MDDVNTTTTMTTTTTTTTHTTSISFNVNYLCSLPGILKILELIFGLLCWALIASLASLPGATLNSDFQFVMFVSVTSWVLTLISLGIYLMALHATTCSGAPWSIMEFCFNLFWALMYFIAACISASYTNSFITSSTLSAATAFAFFTTIVYIIHTVFSFKAWRGVFPWQGGCSPTASGQPTNP